MGSHCAVLELHNLSLGFGNDEIISIDSLCLFPNTITGLLGPSGSGKSSIFGAISGVNTTPAYWQSGEIRLNSEPLSAALRNKDIASVSQKARLYTGTVLENFLDGLTAGKGATDDERQRLAEETFKRYHLWAYFAEILLEPAIEQSMGIHKLVLIARAAASNPRLILLDEPLANTSLADESLLIEFIIQLKRFTTVCVITHNKNEAEKYCDFIAFISGGSLHEITPSVDFFKRPDSAIGREFLLSGSAWYSNEHKPTSNAHEKLAALRRFSSISEFFWVNPNTIGGMQRPGLLTDLSVDLQIMKKLGVQYLISLTQQAISSQSLNDHDIEGIHFPITDMSIPTLKETHQLMLACEAILLTGKSIVFHCKAGMGRTGTMLACSLVWTEKLTAISAIEKIRKINHKYIQTDEQYAFVSDYESYLINSNQ